MEGVTERPTGGRPGGGRGGRTEQGHCACSLSSARLCVRGPAPGLTRGVCLERLPYRPDPLGRPKPEAAESPELVSGNESCG